METFEQHPQQWTGIPERPERPRFGLLLLAMIFGALIGGAVVYFAVDDSSDSTASPDDSPADTTTTAASTTSTLAPLQSMADLANQATYPVEGSVTGFISLVDGTAEESNADTGENLVVTLTNTFATDLDNDGTDDAVVVLSVDTGSGQLHYVYGLFGDAAQTVVTNPTVLADSASIDAISVHPVSSFVSVRYRSRSDSAAADEAPDTLTVVDLLILSSGTQTAGSGSILLVDSDDPQVTTASTITTGGLGPVRVGMTPAQATDAAGMILVAPTDSAVTPSEGCGFARLDGFDGARFMLIDGVIARVDVGSGPTGTASGAMIGSTEQEIKDLFPGVIVVTPHAYTDGNYLTLVPEAENLADFRVVFETDGSVVTSYRAGRTPEVEWIEGCA